LNPCKRRCPLDPRNLFAQMSPTKEVRYTSHSVSPSPHGRSRSVSPSPRRRSRSRSFSRDRSRSLSRSRGRGAPNPGNNLYVTGLSTRVSSSDLEKYFNKEGKVLDCEVIRDPRTRESRGFGFVTMETLDDANRCVRYLNRSVLEGRLITVEKVLTFTLYMILNDINKQFICCFPIFVFLYIVQIATGDAPAATLPIGGGTEVVPGLGTDGIDPIHHTGKMGRGGSDHCLPVAMGTDQISSHCPYFLIWAYWSSSCRRRILCNRNFHRRYMRGHELYLGVRSCRILFRSSMSSYHALGVL
ncbi:hypothetical protein Taro_052655, partial [Colocasia esculenta]|nr:hypothetical protein [Colocasia esculenta]